MYVAVETLVIVILTVAVLVMVLVELVGAAGAEVTALGGELLVVVAGRVAEPLVVEALPSLCGGD